MKDGVCPKCNSREIIEKLPVNEYGDYNYQIPLALEVHAKPQAMIFKDTAKSRLYAWVCVKCGYVELYTEYPKELLEAYRKAQAAREDFAS